MDSVTLIKEAMFNKEAKAAAGKKAVEAVAKPSLLRRILWEPFGNPEAAKQTAKKTFDTDFNKVLASKTLLNKNKGYTKQLKAAMGGNTIQSGKLEEKMLRLSTPGVLEKVPGLKYKMGKKRLRKLRDIKADIRAFSRAGSKYQSTMAGAEARRAGNIAARVGVYGTAGVGGGAGVAKMNKKIKEKKLK